MKLFEVDHAFYCAEGNYYSTKCFDKYESWEEYEAAWKGYDIDLNLIFRWDWWKSDPSDYEEGEENKGDYITIHRVLQRKAILRSDRVYVSEADEPAIRKYLEPYAQRMKDIWEPLL